MWIGNRSNALKIIERLLKGLGNKAPKICEMSQVGPLHAASFYDEEVGERLIREEVCTGMSRNPDLAILKGLVEHIERLAIREGRKTSLPVFQTQRSDGFAAFPVDGWFRKSANKCARDHAMAEAIERLVWANWWDNPEISHSTRANIDSQTAWAFDILKAIDTIYAIEKFHLIEPRVESTSYSVVILFVELKGGGICSGGACSTVTHRHIALERALGELARHVACAANLKSGKKAATFYENRLEYMLTSRAHNSLLRRIEQHGTETVRLPHLKFDELVAHEFAELVSVHRCYFENQPPFIGGAVERLCL